MRKIILYICAALVLAPIVASAASKSAATTQASYRYNRITETITVRPDGTVHIEEPITMLFNGSYHYLWEVLPVASTSIVSNIAIRDGSTGEPYAIVPGGTELDGTQSANWGKYVTWVKDGTTNVEWYFSTRDRVHTWVMSYDVRGIVSLLPDHDELSWQVVAGYGVPVDTIEAEVVLPGAITNPSADLYSTYNNDYYIDRPDTNTYRFRVSDIESGEQVSLSVGWQKGLVSPHVDYKAVVLLWLKIPLVRWGLGGLAALIILGGAFLYIYVYRRAWPVGAWRWCKSLIGPLYAMAKGRILKSGGDKSSSL